MKEQVWDVMVCLFIWHLVSCIFSIDLDFLLVVAGSLCCPILQFMVHRVRGGFAVLCFNGHDIFDILFFYCRLMRCSQF